jgi:transposase
LGRKESLKIRPSLARGLEWMAFQGSSPSQSNKLDRIWALAGLLPNLKTSERFKRITKRHNSKSKGFGSKKSGKSHRRTENI